MLDERGMKLGRRCTGRLIRRDLKTSTKMESKEGPSWGSESISSLRATSRRCSAKKSDEYPCEEIVAKSTSPTVSEQKSSGDMETSPLSSKKLVSSSISMENTSSGKTHLPSSSEEDDVPPILSSKHSLLPEEEDSVSKSASSVTPPIKSRMSPYGPISSSSSMFSPRKSPSPSPPAAGSPPSMSSLDLEPLCLFGDLPSSADGDGGEEDDAGDESGDRLIISDDPGEPEQPLFTYPQRHEELFPASLVSIGAVGSSSDVDDTEHHLRKQSDEEPPCLVPMSMFELPKKSVEKESDLNAGVERSEVVKVVVQKEEDGAETEAVLVEKPQAPKCSVPFNDDVIKLLLKDEDEDEGEGERDESINAAIQRVISSNITDEDDDDESLSLFSKKAAKELFQHGGNEKEITSSEKAEETAKKVLPKNLITLESPKVESCKTGSLQEAPPPKQPEPSVKVLTPLVENLCVIAQGNDSSSDTDSDSSEESRLVIDKLDEGGEDDSVQSSDDEAEHEKKEVKEDDPPAEGDIIADHTTTIPARENPPVDEVICVKEVKEESKGETVDVGRDTESEKLCSAQVSPMEKGAEESVSKEKVNQKEEVSDWKTEPAEDVESKQLESQQKVDEEADSSLRSLLCEETIPGSPVPPPVDSPDGCCPEIPEKQTKVPEMPFASIPGSENCSTGSLLRSDDIRNEGSVCSGGLSTNSQLKGSLEAFACESNAAIIACPPVPHLEEAHILEAEAPSSATCKGKDSGGNDAAPVMDNTPPTTPESSLSTISGSPREERGGSSPGLDNESSKSHRESSEIDLDSPVEGHKVDHFSEDSLLNIEVSNSEDNNRLLLLQELKVSSPQKRSGGPDSEKDTSGIVVGSVGQDSPSKKRRRPHRRSEDPVVQGTKRLRHGSGRGRTMGGSDSDDTSENSTSGGCASSSANAENIISSRSPRPSKYNFYVELDPELDGTQRIALLQQKLQELRKTYMSVKAELACIDRRRKKLRRREREAEKAAKHEVACS